MHWGSVSEFFAMGGHGFFVWTAWGVTFALVIGEMICQRLKFRDTVKNVRRAAQLSETEENEELGE